MEAAGGSSREPLAVAFRPAWSGGEGGIALADVGRLAELAEAAGVDLLLVEAAGGPALAPDPISVAGALIAQTRCIGLGAEIATSDWAPFNVARAFSALDLLSGGRSAWLASAGADPPSRHAEHLEVVFSLFDSWDDDALVLDKAAGLFTDPRRVRRIAHQGPHFTVDGPLNSPRPRQGRPLVLQRAAEATPAADLVIGGAGPSATPRLVEVEFTDSVRLADRIGELFGSGVGVLLRPRSLADMEVFAGQTAARLLRRAPVGADLRGRLGFPRPHHRFHPMPEAAYAR